MTAILILQAINTISTVWPRASLAADRIRTYFDMTDVKCRTQVYTVEAHVT